MGLVSTCAFSFMSKYLHQSCGPKPMTRVDIKDNNQYSNTSQRNGLLSALGSLDPSGLKVIKFEVMDVKLLFPYHVEFQIHVGYSKYTIIHVVVDEGATTCVMSLICWKDFGYPNISQSQTMMTDFDGPSFLPHRILPAFPI
jgi:hypothetical protein